MKIDISKLYNVFIVILLIFFSKGLLAQSYGLAFSSFESVQEKRTSLDLGAGEPICLAEEGFLSFDLQFLPYNPTYFGYIVRMINADNQNIDLVYEEKNSKFNVIAGDALTGISLKIDKQVLLNQWTSLKLAWTAGELALYVNGQPVGKTKVAINDYCFKIVFGACNLHNFKTTDLPPMKLANIRMGTNNKPAYFWPLNELQGSYCQDSMKHKKGLVSNGTWVRPLHVRWKLLQSVKLKGNGSMAFDKDKEALYLVAKDSVYVFSVKEKKVTATPLASERHYLSLGNQSFYHPLERNLYNYYIDKGQMSAFMAAERSWAPASDSADATQYWQANRFFSATQNALYILGGYGQLKYKNSIVRYRFNERRWDTILPGGDLFIPRYLATLGATATGDSAYLLGGYGSMTGEQIVNPKYLYDFLLFNATTHTFKKLYTLKEPKEPFVFASTMVLDEKDKCYYALCFPNDRFESKLKLIRGSLSSPDYTWLGDSIPYAFQDTKSFAGLFYCSQARCLLAATLLVDKEKGTQAYIYSIAFPPGELPAAAEPQQAGFPLWLFGIAGGALLLAGFWWFRRTPKGIAKKVVPPLPPPVEAPVYVPADMLAVETHGLPGAVISLFGHFGVMDKEGQDITRLFTPLLKELFLLITIYTVSNGHGITSEKLTEILWSDKSDKDAKNNRSVNIAKLKAILEKLGGCLVKKEVDKWQLQYNKEEIHIDLAALLQLTTGKQPVSSDAVKQVLRVIKRGAFLSQTDYPWLDDIKSDISNEVIDYLLNAGTALASSSQAELMIEIANGIFSFDEVNEEALKLKCSSLIALGRHSLARNAYDKFAREYRHIYGEEFPRSFQDLSLG